MALDRSKVSEHLMSEQMAARLAKGGWLFFAKQKGRDWRNYFLDGEDGLIMEESIAREFYKLVLKDPSCEAAHLLQIKPVSGFDNKTALL